MSESMRALGSFPCPSSESEPDRISYARDLWPRHHIAVRDGAIAEHKPAGIVWPRSTEEVAAIVSRCRSEGIPLVPFGAGSGVAGGILPNEDSVILDLKRMTKLRGIEGDVLEVESGLMGIRLEEDLEAQGHTLGHFPSSILCSTVGGWIAARSAGQCSGYYGKIEDMVVSLDCVLGTGEIVRLRRRTQGPDLTPLMIGSEGVLGVVTSAQLRIFPKPEARAYAAFAFPSTEAGWEAMRAMFQAGLRPAVARLYDAFDSFMARRGAVSGKKSKSSGVPSEGAFSTLRKNAKSTALRLLLRAPSVLNRMVDGVGDKAFGGAMLVLVFEGPVAHHAEDLARVRHIVARLDGKDLGEGPARHWFSHRYAVSYRQAPVFMSGAFSDTMEVAAPWSKLKGLYENVRRAMGPHVFVMAHLSHAYPDGCSIYFTFAGSAKTRAESESLYDQTWRDALDAVLAAGGTISHHHGVGRSKAPKLGGELGLGVQVVRALQRACDPAGIMNPGNLLPKADPARPSHRSERPQVAAPRFDDVSQLVWANGDTSVQRLEDQARARGYSLRLSGADQGETIAAYLARGAPGSPDPFEDPVDHLLAGFTADLPSGDELVVHPGPRRAVGPDLFALFLGLNERVGRIGAAHLRLYPAGLETRCKATSIARNPSLDAKERLFLEAVVREAKLARYGDS